MMRKWTVLAALSLCIAEGAKAASEIGGVDIDTMIEKVAHCLSNASLGLYN
jgi:hypothetical protein